MHESNESTKHVGTINETQYWDQQNVALAKLLQQTIVDVESAKLSHAYPKLVLLKFFEIGQVQS